jgi:Holliday junction resolvasome RuvABC endonuclease subunit
MIRTPIKYGRNYSLVVLGVDPGIRTTGLSIVGLDNAGQYCCLGSQYIETKKQDKKSINQLRTNIDDFRRYREVYEELEHLYLSHNARLGQIISAVAIESYTVMRYKNQKSEIIIGNNAWKSAVVYGGVLFWALSRQLYVAPFFPNDIKKRFGKKDKSKEGIQLAVESEVSNFYEEIHKYSKTKREHVSDATAHAVLLIEEIQKNRVFIGGINETT